MSGAITLTRQSPGGVGKGNVKKATQQEVTTITTYGLNTKTVHKQDASTGNAYVTRDGAMVYDIMDGEPLYSDLSMPNANPHGEPYVLSSLNGIGRAAVSAFPNDSEMQRLAIKHHIAPKGFAVGNHREDSTGQTKISSQVGGTVSIWFDEDIPEGSLVALDIPSKEELNNPQFTKKPSGAPTNKALCKVVAYQPKNISNSFSTHISNILARPQDYDRVMNSDNKNHSLGEAARAIFDSQLTSFVLGAYALFTTAGLGVGGDAVGNIAAATDRAKRLAVGLGLVTDDSTVNLTQAEKDTFKSFKATLLNTINWNGNRQTALGQLTLGIGPNTTAGQLVQKQYTHWKRAIEAYNQFVYEDSRLVIGKVTEGALAKHRGIVLISL